MPNCQVKTEISHRFVNTVEKLFLASSLTKDLNCIKRKKKLMTVKLISSEGKSNLPKNFWFNKNTLLKHHFVVNINLKIRLYDVKLTFFL